MFSVGIWRYYNVGAINCMILIFELVFAGLMVLVLDEISKGYGLDSGISLFIATTISENIMLKSFSHLTIISEWGIWRGYNYHWAFINGKKNQFDAIHGAFYRNNAPNLSNLVATVIVFLVVIYFQGFRKEIKIASKQVPGLYMTQPHYFLYLFY